jgi:hypothetical protein
MMRRISTPTGESRNREMAEGVARNADGVNSFCCECESMKDPMDEFIAKWQSLSDIQRSFLLAAYDIDRRLSHSHGFDKVLPPISWRTVGLIARVESSELDQLVNTLADLHMIYIIDPSMCEFGLLCDTAVYLMMSEKRRRRWERISMVAPLLVAAGYLLLKYLY